MPNIPQKNLDTQSSSTSHHSLPKNISLDKWADAGFEWSGHISPCSFKRLQPLLDSQHSQSDLALSLILSKSDNVLNLRFKLAGEIWLTCQRCLQPVAIDLTDIYNIALLEDESQANLLPEDGDYLLLDEIIDLSDNEHHHQSAVLPLSELIEDEILLITPLAPKHAHCDMAVEQVGDIPDEKENPFSALAALKGKLS